LLLSLR